MKTVVVTVIVLSLAALASVPTAFATHVPTTGTQLTIYLALQQGCSFRNPDVRAKPLEWPASSAFFVRHGWVADLNSLTQEERRAFLGPATNFELYLDGVELQAIQDLDQRETFTTKLFVNNFPDGLTGTHELRGWWFLDGLFTGGTQGEPVFAEACALNVSFV